MMSMLPASGARLAAAAAAHARTMSTRARKEVVIVGAARTPIGGFRG